MGVLPRPTGHAVICSKVSPEPNPSRKHLCNSVNREFDDQCSGDETRTLIRGRHCKLCVYLGRVKLHPSYLTILGFSYTFTPNVGYIRQEYVTPAMNFWGKNHFDILVYSYFHI